MKKLIALSLFLSLSTISNALAKPGDCQITSHIYNTETGKAEATFVQPVFSLQLLDHCIHHLQQTSQQLQQQLSHHVYPFSGSSSARVEMTFDYGGTPLSANIKFAIQVQKQQPQQSSRD